MKFSRREEIAVAILIACARAGFDRIRTEDAAIAAEATPMQTAQVVHLLMRHGLIDTLRGQHGGICLSRRAEQITLGMVLDGVGAKRRLPAVQPGNGTLDAIARVATSRALDAYDSFTIADLAREQVADKLSCLDCSIRLGAVTPMHIPNARSRSPLQAGA